MTEDFLQFIWQRGLFVQQDNHTDGGELVEVVRMGMLNTHAGPDFTDARIRIGDTLWAGCVEIHLRSSDWEKHGHHTDAAYNNVILHVVYQHDAPAYNALRAKVPVMELRFDDRYFQNYLQLSDSKEKIACKDKIALIDDFSRMNWLDRLAVERLEQKSEAIMQTCEATGHDWEETFYRRLARNFGFSLNSLPFESLAKSLPLRILQKHSDHLQQLEALLFGQAGMLQEKMPENEYYSALQSEYRFLQTKYNLMPIEGFLWKFLRLRPVNFPTLRIAQFAALLYQSEPLFSRIITAKDLSAKESIFAIEASPFWDNHYVFGKISDKRRKVLGKSAFLSIMINTVAPFLFVYGKARGKEDDCIRAVELLGQLPAEHNSIITGWETLGFRIDNAFTSQALLQLQNEYCNARRCLHCAFGNAIVKSSTE
ncbi:MAG: DUF2851 family protein [Bacteroidales bacterium]|jgi:hypothetical protein|nr:DUF2851 family protein [Bacteroidales bacterium]